MVGVRPPQVFGQAVQRLLIKPSAERHQEEPEQQAEYGGENPSEPRVLEDG